MLLFRINGSSNPEKGNPGLAASRKSESGTHTHDYVVVCLYHYAGVRMMYAVARAGTAAVYAFVKVPRSTPAHTS